MGRDDATRRVDAGGVRQRGMFTRGGERKIFEHSGSSSGGYVGTWPRWLSSMIDTAVVATLAHLRFEINNYKRARLARKLGGSGGDDSK